MKKKRERVARPPFRRRDPVVVDPETIDANTDDDAVLAELEAEADKAYGSFANRDIRGTIIAALAAGSSVANAARYAGVSPSAFREWYAIGKNLVEGKRSTKEYRKFAADVDKARAKLNVLAGATLVAAMQDRLLVKVGEKRTIKGDTITVEAVMRERISPVALSAAQSALVATDPKKWGTGKQRIELTGAEGAPIEVMAVDELGSINSKVRSLLGGIALAAMKANAGRLPVPVDVEMLDSAPVDEDTE